MKKITLFMLALCAISISKNTTAQLPKYAHVVFVLEENFAYSEIIGSSSAPTLTALSKTYYTASFTQAFAITHPSEPNYLDLFSGSNQGVTTDESGPDANAPFNDCNLGSSLIQKGYTFIGYSEGQPSVGWIAGDVGNYYTKHCPWINWIGYNTNKDTIPEKSDQPFTSFPDSNHFSTLPTVSWVIPNSIDDMHDGSAPTSIQNGDSWFKTHIMPLVRWAVKNNTLVITIWDEDDLAHSNNIPCLFSGPNIIGGSYSTPKFNHYDVLKTIEDMYSLSPLCGSSSSGTDLTGFWSLTGVSNVQSTVNDITIWPIPAKGQLNVKVTSNVNEKDVISIFDMTGRIVKENNIEMKSGENEYNLDITGLSNGIYFVKVNGATTNICKKVVVQN